MERLRLTLGSYPNPLQTCPKTRWRAGGHVRSSPKCHAFLLWNTGDIVSMRGAGIGPFSVSPCEHADRTACFFSRGVTSARRVRGTCSRTAIAFPLRGHHDAASTFVVLGEYAVPPPRFHLERSIKRNSNSLRCCSGAGAASHTHLNLVKAPRFVTALKRHGCPGWKRS